MDSWILLAVLSGIVVVLLDQLRREIRRKVPSRSFDTAAQPAAAPHPLPSVPIEPPAVAVVMSADAALPAMPVIAGEGTAPKRPVRHRKRAAEKTPAATLSNPARAFLGRLFQERDAAAAGFVLGEIFGPPLSRRRPPPRPSTRNPGALNHKKTK